ncbi:hypothetical protein PoB_000827500 [Plakobranchus ocellatus]|uniref:Uncharacterized protein n=1 Tax=Plakobranchus ocellatus TaxID=259542 RepID=A0AAV3YFB9_9GAST|nr:hypothetical protein PoB_000827500 [Plakobranchus ocellatus]
MSLNISTGFSSSVNNLSLYASCTASEPSQFEFTGTLVHWLIAVFHPVLMHSAKLTALGSQLYSSAASFAFIITSDAEFFVLIFELASVTLRSELSLFLCPALCRLKYLVPHLTLVICVR